MENAESKLYGVQFHPEVDLTENGKAMFSNFLFKVAKLSPNYTMADRKEIAIKQIQKAAGENNKVLVLVSGGVDSAVCAALLAKALPHDRIHALHIDNGFMRKDESKNVIEALGRVGLKIHHVDASQQFFSGTTKLNNGTQTKRLDETAEPEEKRKIIGDTFVHVAQREIEKLGLKFDEVLLAQGTLRPDLIESASHTVSANAAVIKTHHNDTNLIRELRSAGRVLEPLSEYHKDEVRALGRDLGLPDDLVQRQPFPGPGLSVRIICTEKGYLDASFEETNRLLGLFLSNPEHSDIAATLHELRPEEKQALSEIAKNKDATRAFILPMRTVGVQGDGRSYKYLCALTGANPENPRWDDLMFLAKLIPKIFQNINRLVYVFGPQVTAAPPTVAVKTHLTPDVIHLLQEADDIANRELMRTGQLQKVAQVPIILFPVGFDGVAEQNRSIAIRTLITLDFMTGRPAVPGKDIDGTILLSVARQIKEKLPSVSRVVYDLTSKPPATTEWE
jgi:GMP synthase (glutamine-hydrolysing)